MESERAQRDRLETSLTARRIAQLHLEPVQGQFDAAHLREVHRRIFQDFPSAGLDHITPGVFRQPTPAGLDWVKERQLVSVRTSYTVAYSRMTEADQEEIGTLLRRAPRPKELRHAKTREFAAHASELYGALDAKHPFDEGNSRALREFLREWGVQSGFEIQWEKLGSSDAARDTLYVARDLAVSRIVISQVEHTDTGRSVRTTLDRLEGNLELPDLFREITRPSRALAFQQSSEAAAVRLHPELESLYQGLHALQESLAHRFPRDVISRDKYYAAAKSDILTRLNEGEILAYRSPLASDQHALMQRGKQLSSLDEWER